MTRTIDLPIETASPEILAPFGQIAGTNSTPQLMPIDFYKGAVEVGQPVSFHCKHPIELTPSRLDLRPGEVRFMERHFQHTQAFIPIGGKPYVVVMAPPTDGDLPDLAAARAFRFDGSQSLVMHVGTWHEFPFAMEPDTDILVILSAQTGYDLKNGNPETEEAFGPDLDKKDIVVRTGTVLRVGLQQGAK
ncbi:ureidoglycolate lyase [Parasphingorhabdus sp.]|uniref:ureidoglycolate lyase n=1 Tax=Parasphingorhabdus sp. TaxID=2709688 RepID=UPI0032651446